MISEFNYLYTRSVHGVDKNLPEHTIGYPVEYAVLSHSAIAEKSHLSHLEYLSKNNGAVHFGGWLSLHRLHDETDFLGFFKTNYSKPDGALLLSIGQYLTEDANIFLNVVSGEVRIKDFTWDSVYSMLVDILPLLVRPYIRDSALTANPACPELETLLDGVELSTNKTYEDYLHCFEELTRDLAMTDTRELTALRLRQEQLTNAFRACANDQFMGTLKDCTKDAKLEYLESVFIELRRSLEDLNAKKGLKLLNKFFKKGASLPYISSETSGYLLDFIERQERYYGEPEVGKAIEVAFVLWSFNSAILAEYSLNSLSELMLGIWEYASFLPEKQAEAFCASLLRIKAPPL